MMTMRSVQPLPDPILRAAQTLVSIAPHLPTHAAIEPLLAQVETVQARGYFFPHEDEAVREAFARYLTTRAALTATLRDLAPFVRETYRLRKDLRLEAFAVAFCTACLLVRSGRFIVDTFHEYPVIWNKLDEAEPRYGIPRKQYTIGYRALTSLRNILPFQEAIRYADAHRAELDALADHPDLAPIIDLLRWEAPYIEARWEYYTQRMLWYRAHSFLRRQRSGYHKITFALFKISGSLIAEVRMKWKRKRATPRVRAKAARLLRPGDIIITRHDDAASNLFLPGFWPHGALYIGTEPERLALGVELSDDRRSRSGGDICVLEARKDGVRLRPLTDTLAVDAFTVIRPRLEDAHLRTALSRALTHEGKEYDFEFDFRRADKLVCTEVIYRAYDGIGPIRFPLTPRAGRLCLSAEDILDAALAGEHFEVVLVYGARGNRFVTGPRAAEALAASYDSATAGSPGPGGRTSRPPRIQAEES